MASKLGQKSAARATEKREQQKTARMKKEPVKGDDFGRIPVAKAADTAARDNKAAAKKSAADQKKKQQRRGK